MMKKYRVTTLACLAVVLGLLVTTAGAETIAIEGNPADRPIFTDNGDLGGNDGANGIVFGSLNSREIAVMLVFELPDLGEGQTIGTANLSVVTAPYISTDGTPDFDVDLLGVGWRSGSPDVIAGDATGGTLIQDNDFMTVYPHPGGGVTFSTDTAADAELASFLIAAYAGGAEAGDYVFLRANPDNWTVPATKNFMRVWGSENDPASVRPLLTVETVPVPEPSTIVSLIFAVLAGLFAVRRQSVA